MDRSLENEWPAGLLRARSVSVRMSGSRRRQGEQTDPQIRESACPMPEFLPRLLPQPAPAGCFSHPRPHTVHGTSVRPSMLPFQPWTLGCTADARGKSDLTLPAHCVRRQETSPLFFRLPCTLRMSGPGWCPARQEKRPAPGGAETLCRQRAPDSACCLTECPGVPSGSH